jgi:hypothetical protein
MSKNTKGYQAPTHPEIAALAQRIYEREGRPEGKAMDHWLRAEAQLIAERKTQAAATTAKAAPATPAPQKPQTAPAAASAPPAKPAAWQNTPRQSQSRN